MSEGYTLQCSLWVGMFLWLLGGRPPIHLVHFVFAIHMVCSYCRLELTIFSDLGVEVLCAGSRVHSSRIYIKNMFTFTLMGVYYLWLS